MNIRTHLNEIAKQKGIDTEYLQLPDCELDPENIHVMMISEVPAQNPDDDFYSNLPQPEYMNSTLGLFEKAGVYVKSMQDILNLGIYITTAVKIPKTSYTVDPEVIKAHLPILEAEIALFPNLKVIMLMGDVAKKAVNMITKARTKKNVIPSKPTGYIRMNEFYWDGIRVFPTYIMTGKNLLIEKGKCGTISEDIRRMMAVIKKV
jgi:uracil-DNA glycosylase